MFSMSILYAAYLLWFLPFVLYFSGRADLLTAGLWLVGVVIAQFVLLKLISFVEYLCTAKKIKQLRAKEDSEAPNFGEID